VICFVCGRPLPAIDRVAITGHLPPSRPGAHQDPTIRLHAPCAIALAAELLRGEVRDGPPLRATAMETVALTSREQSILEGIVAGQTNRQIAVGMKLAEKTVKNAVTEILSKLGACSRTEAAVVAIRAGLVLTP
jgi:DNA-binding NarL/FixJ family response regulator